jgi:c(7)-type cytochrome triheme protein
MKKIIFALFTVLLFFTTITCFAADDEGGGLIIFEKPVAGVVFDHEIHSDLDCSDCHDDIFQQEAGSTSDNSDFTMKSMEDGETCGNCHDGDMAFSVKRHCVKCHIGKMNTEK